MTIFCSFCFFQGILLLLYCLINQEVSQIDHLFYSLYYEVTNRGKSLNLSETSLNKDFSY